MFYDFVVYFQTYLWQQMLNNLFDCEFLTYFKGHKITKDAMWICLAFFTEKNYYINT